MFGLLSACIGWYAGTFFESSAKLPCYENSVAFLNYEITEFRVRSSSPHKELYKLGYILYDNGWYNASDEILRFTAAMSEKDLKWLDWELGAKGILMQDDFQAFYESGGGISNTFYLHDIDDKQLFDKESVRRKYGKPTKVNKPTESLKHEKWLYCDEDGNVAMEFEFQNARLIKMIPDGG